MQSFYRNSSPFFYNNIYRKRLISPSYNFSLNNLKNYNNNFSEDKFNNNIITNFAETSNTPSSYELPPNKDFVLDLLGLKLYFDDVLILSLLFFLYKEDVKDEGLFLALVLLLIS